MRSSARQSHRVPLPTDMAGISDRLRPESATDITGIRTYLEAEAKKRQAANVITMNTGSVPVKLPELEKGDSREKAAAMVGASARYISDAKKLKEENPEAFAQVKSGGIFALFRGRGKEEASCFGWVSTKYGFRPYAIFGGRY